MRNNYTKITYEYALSFQTGEACHPAYGYIFVNLSDINRYMVWCETGLPLCVVDTRWQANAETILYAWSVLNGRPSTISSTPIFSTNEQIEYVKSRIHEDEIIGLKPRHQSIAITYLVKTVDSYRPLGFMEISKREAHEKLHEIQLAGYYNV